MLLLALVPAAPRGRSFRIERGVEARLLRAEQRVHHDAAHPSRVVLAVVPR